VFFSTNFFQPDLSSYTHTDGGVGMNGVKTDFNLFEITNLIYINGEKNPEVSA